MKLKKGSYLYILGMLFLFWSSLFSLCAFWCTYRYKNVRSDENQLMNEFGAAFAGSNSALVMSGAFVVVSLVLAILILRYGIRTNSISVPLRIVGITILPLSLASMAAMWAFLEQGGTLTTLAVRLIGAVPAFLFGVNLIRVSLNQKNSRMLTVFFGAMSGYAVYSEFGFGQILLADFSLITKQSFLGWISVYFFSTALCLFFVGLCLCVSGCERKSTKRTLIQKKD